MDDLTFSAGMALFLALCLALLALWAVLASGPSRQWIRRMQQIKDGKAHQEAEWINSNVFPSWRDHK